MSELLTDEELAGYRTNAENSDYYPDHAALVAHIDALTEQRDRARDMVISLEAEAAARAEFEAYPIRYAIGAVEPTPEQIAEWAAHPGRLTILPPDTTTIGRGIQGDSVTIPTPPIEERALDALLGFTGGHAHANQQAIEGEA